MTLLVATAMGDTPDALYEACRRASEEADLVEVRLDGPSGLPWDLRPFFQLPRPTIATMRHADDGGRTHADDATRADVLRRALKAGAGAIDVEWLSDQRDALAQEARAAGAKVLFSHHDLSGTPPGEDLVADLRAMRAAGADWCKIATRVAGPEDAVALVRAAHAAREEGIPFALMAVNDPFLRLLAPGLGMALAYGAPRGQPPAAPGQVPLAALRDAHARLGAGSARGGARTRGAFLLGHPVAHSRSPAMQNAAFAAMGVDAAYLALDVAPDDLAAVLDGLRRAGALGVNLTIPHKVAALALVDELDATAKAAGAVNAVALRDGRTVGHNTDGLGALDALSEAGVRVQGEAVLVLGAGGAARGVAAALRDAGAQVVVANRTLDKAKAVAADLGVLWIPWEDVAKALARVALLVNCTSLGLEDPDACPVDPASLGRHAVLDAVYREGGTRLAREAQARGLVVVDGEAMLLHQGARAFTLWTGKPAPVAAMRAALRGVRA